MWFMGKMRSRCPVGKQSSIGCRFFFSGLDGWLRDLEVAFQGLSLSSGVLTWLLSRRWCKGTKGRVDGEGGFWEEVEKEGVGWEMMEASETRRPSVKEMREGEKPRFGSGSVAREGEIKVPSFPAASSGLWPSPLQLFVCLYAFNP